MGTINTSTPKYDEGTTSPPIDTCLRQEGWKSKFLFGDFFNLRFRNRIVK